jgi:hypothetical protein
MKRAILTLGVVVLAFNLAAVAAGDGTLITTQPKAGGTVYGGAGPWVPPIFNNLALAYPSGLYYCCEGFLIAGPQNPASQPNVAEGLQFTTTKATTLHELVTSVNYILEAGTTNHFFIAIEGDASGLPSGNPLTYVKVTMNGQRYGTCCALQTKRVAGSKGFPLPAGSYWVVWYTDAGSDLYAEVNQEITDQVISKNVAYSNSNGVPGSWVPYPPTIQAPAIELK